MKNYQRRVRENIDDIIAKMRVHLMKLEQKLSNNIMNNQKSDLITVKNFNELKEQVIIAETIKDILDGKEEINRIVTISSFIDNILFSLDLSSKEIKNIFFDFVMADYRTCSKNIHEKTVLISMPDKIFLQQHQISLERLLLFLDDDVYQEKIYQKYPDIAEKLISIITDARKNFFEIHESLASVNKSYLNFKKKSTKESYEAIITCLSKMGISTKLFQILKEELRKEIQLEKPTHQERKEDYNVPIQLVTKKKDATLRNKLEENKLQELNQYFSRKLGEAKRPLKLEEQERLGELLIYFGYTSNQCKSILQKNRYQMPCLEKYPKMDLIDKINLVITLQKTYHSQKEIIDILEKVDKSEIDNLKLTKQERIMRNLRIIKLLTSYIINNNAPIEKELADLWDEIKQMRPEHREEREEWKKLIREILIEEYMKNNNFIAIEEASRTRRKERSE